MIKQKTKRRSGNRLWSRSNYDRRTACGSWWGSLSSFNYEAVNLFEKQRDAKETAGEATACSRRTSERHVGLESTRKVIAPPDAFGERKLQCIPRKGLPGGRIAAEAGRKRGVAL